MTTFPPISAALQAQLNKLPFFPPVTAPYALGDALQALDERVQTGAFKSADQSIANTAALQDDSALTVALEAGRIYHLMINAFATLGNSGIKVALSGTAVLASLKAQVSVWDGAGSRVYERITAMNQVVSHASAGQGDHFVTFQGAFQVTTGGTMFLQWGQQSSSNQTLTMQKDSSMCVCLIG